LGVPCRYDGGSKPNEEVIRFLERHECEVIRICPEVMGGLSIPHPANEIQVREGKRVVCDIEGNDNTDAFEKGARIACERACEKGCTHAILKAKSPSCGVGKIYDGTFSGILIPGDGVAADLLRTQGIALATEETFKDLFGSDFELALAGPPMRYVVWRAIGSFNRIVPSKSSSKRISSNSEA